MKNASMASRLGGLAAFFMMVGGWTAVNYFGGAEKYEASCQVGTGMQAPPEFCTCIGKEMRDSAGVASYIPFVGSAFKPDGDQIRANSSAANEVCGRDEWLASR